MSEVQTKKIVIDALPIEQTETMPELQPFPVECLPFQLQLFIAECTEHLTFHHDFISAGTLFSYGFTVRNSCTIYINSSWQEQPNIFCAFIAPSGTGKSHPLEYVLKPLRKIDSDSYKVFNDAKRDYEMLEKSVRLASPLPTLQQLLLNDSTLESLAKVHSQNPQGVVMVRDEFASWLQDMNKYRNGSDETQWLSIWSGKPIKVTRAGKEEPLIIESPCVSVIGTMQPALLPMFSANGRNVSGFIDRMLFVYPDNVKARYPSESEPNDTIIKDYQKSIIDTFQFTHGKKLTINLDRDSRLLFKRYQEQNVDLINDTENDWEKSLHAKYDNHVLRIALCLHIAEWSFSHSREIDLISNDTMQNAILIADWFRQNAYKVRFELYSTLVSNDKTNLVRTLSSQGMSVRQISEHTGIPKSTVQDYKY